MEVKSEPKYTTVQVTDIDVAFPGDLQTFTLFPQDAFSRVDNTLTLAFAAGGGVMELHLQHAHYVATRVRDQRVLAAEPTVPTA